MTTDRALKRKIRERASRTGESYTAARRQLLGTGADPVLSGSPATEPDVRVAVAQTTPRHDPGDSAAFEAAAAEACALMDRARRSGAVLIQFPEAMLCSPSKWMMSSVPGELAEADWSRFDWNAQNRALAGIREQARKLRLWVVIGVLRRPDDAARPHLSLQVIDSDGQVSVNYDERLLSRTKQNHLYAAGQEPTVFEVAGVRFGCMSGLEMLFPDVCSDYRALDVDCILYSTTGPGDPGAEESLAMSARVAARHNGMWCGYSVPAEAGSGSRGLHEPAGLIDPSGRWVGRCSTPEVPGLTVGVVTRRSEDGAREWHRQTAEAYRAGRTGT